MNDFTNVLCLCPAGRFFLVSLVLSTWTRVQRYVLTEDAAHDLDGFDAVIVMDEFVTKVLVDRLAAKLPVIVLAWNGLFEIRRYRDALRPAADVIYMGTDDTLPPASLGEPIRYMPMINGGCNFAEWRVLARHKRQFRVRGDVIYRLRWLRTELFANRTWCAEISTGAALVKRPHTVRKTIASALVRDKLVWAGNCEFNLAPLGLPERVRSSLEAAVAAVRMASSADLRLNRGLALLGEWQAIGAPAVDPARVHEAFYVTNTLLRWVVLRYLMNAACSSAWFFGSDNVDLGLEYELDLYSLTGHRRNAYLDFGGKTAQNALYPRALQLLARRCYVIAIAPPDFRNGDVSALATTLARLRDRLSRDRRGFFLEIERRRQSLYDGLLPGTTLRDVQRRVWEDFATVDAASNS